MATPADAIAGQLTTQGVNANAALQVPGTLGGTPATPSSTPQLPGSSGTINTNQKSLSDFISSYQDNINTASHGILSSVDQGTQTLQDAIKGLQTQQGSFDTAQQNALQASMSQQSTRFGGTLFNTKAGPNGASTNSILLQQLQNDNTETIKQLQASAAQAMANGDVQFATQISNLQAKQYEMALSAKENILQNLIAEGSSVASLSQAQTSAAQQQEQVQNDMSQIATKYGVTLNPGESWQDLITAVAPKASLQEQLTLSSMQSQINANNASAALASAQASVLAPLGTDQVSGLLSWYVNQVPGSPAQQQVGQTISGALANNPKNMISYANAMNSYMVPHDIPIAPKDGSVSQVAIWVSQAQAQGLSAQDTVSKYVSQNPAVANKPEVSQAIYALYGENPAFNPFVTQLGAGFAGITAPLQSGTFQKLTPATQSVYQAGAEMFNIKNPQFYNTKGANSYVNAITGNNTTSYAEFIQQFRNQTQAPGVTEQFSGPNVPSSGKATIKPKVDFGAINNK